MTEKSGQADVKLSTESGDALPFLAAIDRLARILHASMERRDPSFDPNEQVWETLLPRERDFYMG